MKYLAFFIIAIILGEIISGIILFPIFDELYEPFLEFDFAVKSLTWLLIYVIVPTFVGSVIEISIIKLTKFDFFDSE